MVQGIMWAVRAQSMSNTVQFKQLIKMVLCCGFYLVGRSKKYSMVGVCVCACASLHTTHLIFKRTVLYKTGTISITLVIMTVLAQGRYLKALC